MEFPVDVLEATSHGELERSAHSYMNELLYTDPDHAHHFTLPNGKTVQISLSSVGFVPLYGANLQHKILALFTPQDQLTAVALFLANQWYSVDDILKTANSRRDGLVKVRSVGERIVLYALNRIVYRTKEMSGGEMPFLCHSENDYAKILWKNGQAVGFYSVKPKGNVCNNFLKQCYFLPVMDSVFVRKAHRGKGYGLQMLEDFVDSFNEDELGLKYPLSPAMTSVCRHYLDRYPADVDLLWEVEGVGGPYQRTRVAFKLHSRPRNETHKGGQGENNGRNGDIVEDEGEESEDTCLNITEEMIAVNKHHAITEDVDTPISMCTRSSEHKRRKRVRDEEAKGVDSQPEKINRMEIADEEKKEVVPADGVVAESVPEAPTETLAAGVNSKQVGDKEEVKNGAADEDESAIENCTGSKEEEEMEVEEESGKHKASEQKIVDTSEDPASEQEEAASVAEVNQEMEVYTVAHLQQKENDATVDEEVGVAENEPEQVDAEVAPVSTAMEKQEVAPAAEEKQEVAPNEEDLIAPVSEEEEEELEGVPSGEEEQEKSPATEEEMLVAPTAEKEEGGAPAAEEKQDEASVAVEEEVVTSVQQKVTPEMEKSVDPAGEEEQEAPKNDDNEMAPQGEKQEVDHPSKETSSLATGAEEEQRQGEAMEVLNDFEVPEISEEASGGKEIATLILEEGEAAQKDDEMDEEGEEKDGNYFSKVSRGARSKAAHPASKRNSKRLCKTTLDGNEEDQAEEKAVEEDKGMSTEEEKVTTEEEAEHSSEEDEHVQDPPVTDKRVLRRKTKVIQTKQRTRSKRRSKM